MNKIICKFQFSVLATDWMAVGFRFLRKLPIVKGMVDQELDKAVNEMEEEITK